MNQLPAAERVHIKRMPALDNLEIMHARYRQHVFNRHTHDCYAFGVIEAGAMGFYYLGENMVAPMGSINLAVPGEVHNGQSAHPDGWQYRMLYIQPSLLQRIAEEINGIAGAMPSFSAGVIQDPPLAAKLRRVHALLLQPAVPLLEQEYWLARFLTSMLLRHAENPPAVRRMKKLPQSVAAVTSYLEENYGRNVSINELCRIAALSRFHLVHVFSQEIGVPPHAYLRQVRLRHAKRLLAGGSSIACAAAATGFADQSHLTRWLKRVWGFTPGDYSNSVQYT